jgi:hypothetical protein
MEIEIMSDDKSDARFSEPRTINTHEATYLDASGTGHSLDPLARNESGGSNIAHATVIVINILPTWILSHFFRSAGVKICHKSGMRRGRRLKGKTTWSKRKCQETTWAWVFHVVRI